MREDMLQCMYESPVFIKYSSFKHNLTQKKGTYYDKKTTDRTDPII